MLWFKVFSAVLVANLVTGLISIVLSVFLFASALNVSLTQAQAMLFGGYFTFGQPAVIETSEQAINELREQQRQGRIRRDNERNVQRIHRETCEFWRQAYQNDPTVENQAYRNSACSKI